VEFIETWRYCYEFLAAVIRPVSFVPAYVGWKYIISTASPIRYLLAMF
jgi:hypothetical protein